jgi:hypothetical protein
MRAVESPLILKRAAASRPSGEWNAVVKIAFRFISATCLAACVGGCDLFEDSTARPWHAYGWHRKDSRFEFWFTNFETRGDCLGDTRYAVKTTP